MGTPAFAVPSLKALARGGFRPMAVATGPDKRRGRGGRTSPTPVKAAAEALGMRTILQPPQVKAPSFAEAVQALQPDIIVVVAFRILPRTVFGAARLGAFNLHASLLPRYRGAAPINRALMAGETETGVTTFFLQDRVDTGNVILRWPTRIDPEETAGMLHDRLKALGARAVVETTRRIAEGRAHTAPQDACLATPAPKIFVDDCSIAWDRPAAEVHNHCRGLSPTPGAWTLHGTHRLKILRTRTTRGADHPGTVLENRSQLVVACQSGAIAVLRMQQAGRRPMDAEKFLRGYALPKGTRLG